MTLRGWHAELSRVFIAWCFAAAILALSITGTANASEAHSLLPSPQDIRVDSRQATLDGKPLIVLFSLPDCTFCEVVRRNYLSPLLRSASGQQRMVIREVQITGTDRFSDFDGEPISHRAFATRYKVRFAPTVLLFDASGNVLAAPIVGGDTAGFYGAYLDGALEEASRKLINGRAATNGK